jgi:hypothetical protein
MAGEPGQGMDLSGDARTGCLGNSAVPGLKIRRESEVPFPAESELPLPANLGNVFPKRTSIGRASAFEVHTRPEARRLALTARETRPRFRDRLLGEQDPPARHCCPEIR